MINFEITEKAIVAEMLQCIQDETHPNPEHLQTALRCLEASDFANQYTKAIFVTIKYAVAAGPVDMSTILQRLPQNAASVIFDIMNSTVGICHAFDKHIQELREERKRRDAEQFLAQQAKRATEGVPASELMEDMEQFLEKQKSIGIADVKPVTAEEMRQSLDVLKSAKKIIPTGYWQLDSLIDGIGTGRLIIVAGRPSMGKSTFLMNVALNVILRKQPVAYITLEDTAESLEQRMVFCHSRTSKDTIIKDDTVGIAKAEAAADEIGKTGKLYIRNERTSLKDIEAFVWKVKQTEPNLPLVCIDQLSHIDMDRSGKRPMHQVIGEITCGLKRLAMQTGVTIMLACQVNRTGDSDNLYDAHGYLNKSELPNLTELKDSGSIEQDADVVLFVYHDKGSDSFNGGVMVAKNRNGRIGNVEMKCYPAMMRFASMTK